MRTLAPARAAAAVFAALLAGTSLSACSRKLSRGGNALEVLCYDILKMERSPQEYYQTVRAAHEEKGFEYRCTDDVYLADKSVDGVYRLGNAQFDRLEGEVQVILQLSDIVSEARGALERTVAVGSLTRLALKMPAGAPPPGSSRLDEWFKLLYELDAMHDREWKGGPYAPVRRKTDLPWRPYTAQEVPRVLSIVESLGTFRFSTPADDKRALRALVAAPYVVDETTPNIRDALDRTMVRRSRALIDSTLVGAVQDPSPHARQAAVEGLRALGPPGGPEAVLARLPAENAPLVRAAMADYLGTVGGPKAAVALVDLLDDDDGGVRHRARKALTQVAGRDLGRDPAAWRTWSEGLSKAPAAAASAAPAPAGGGGPR
jgi:hypothetical protein